MGQTTPPRLELEVIAVHEAALVLGLSTEAVLSFLRVRKIPRYLRRVQVRPGTWTHRAYITPEVYAIVRRAYLSRLIPRGGAKPLV